MPRPGPIAEELVNRCLETMARRVTKLGTGQWRYAHPGERKARTEITVHDDWIAVERKLPSGYFASRSRATRRHWQHLDPRFSMASGARPVLPPGETRARIRAERAIVAMRHNEPALLVRWLEMACADTAALADGTPTAGTKFKAGESEVASGTSREDILGLCALGGWPAEARSTADEVTVRLPARDGGVCHAIAAPDGDTVSVYVALEIAGEAESPSCQAAAGIVLLRTAGGVRLVRSTATRDDGRIAAALDVRIQPPVDVETLNHALWALALAQQQVAPELEALAGDDSLADAYLTMQGAR